jgi:GrpB-like predicted nucleotidyltransferase (UPF0157 family)
LTDDVKLVEADPNWPMLFLQEEELLLAALDGVDVLAIEHFGSTAIPGLAAKPIIDILIAVPSVDLARDDFVARLKQLEYVFWPDNPKKDRLFFVKGMPPFGKARTHHIHVAERPSEMWSRLKFRDYLRENDVERDNYAALKASLAIEYGDDREAYTAAKTEFVTRIMRLAEAI